MDSDITWHKSTVSRGDRVHSYLFDGDNVRCGLKAAPDTLEEQHGKAFAQRFGLGFSAKGREENTRRIGAVAKLFCDAGIAELTAFIGPYRGDRDAAVRATLDRGDFVEDDPYETPLNPELHLDGGNEDADSRAGEVITCLERRGVIPMATPTASCER